MNVPDQLIAPVLKLVRKSPVTGFPLERIDYLDLTLEVRGCIEGVVRGFRRAVLNHKPGLYKPWTQKSSKWAG